MAWGQPFEHPLVDRRAGPLAGDRPFLLSGPAALGPTVQQSVLAGGLFLPALSRALSSCVPRPPPRKAVWAAPGLRRAQRTGTGRNLKTVGRYLSPESPAERQEGTFLLPRRARLERETGKRGLGALGASSSRLLRRLKRRGGRRHFSRCIEFTRHPSANLVSTVGFLVFNSTRATASTSDWTTPLKSSIAR